MKNKMVFLFTLLLCAILAFAGCSKADNTPDKKATENSSVSIEEEKTVLFGLGDTVKCEGLCEMSDLYAEVLDDDAKAEGWYYYYTDSDTSPAKTIRWELSKENYTTAEVLFTIKNISNKSQTFSDKITAKLSYQENEDSQIRYFDGTTFQQNPGQVSDTGDVMMWSTKPVEIAVGESTNVSFRFDIPEDVYEKMYETATSKNTKIKETCEFNFGDKTTFVIDLAKSLIPASKYENDK